MELIITEKPSVARVIAEVVGATERQNGYLQGKGFLVSWCVGHLIELALPEVYDAQYARWRYADLPIIPEKWEYTVTAEAKKQFDILKALMNDPRVTGIICATDAGREGELIFRLVYQTAQCRKSVRRLWISSMEESAIREGFRAMKPMSAYDNLYQAALCRAQADWLIGMNATRLYSLLYGPTLHIGRVITDTHNRIGYIYKNALPADVTVPELNLTSIPSVVHYDVEVTDDPLVSRTPLARLTENSKVTCLGTMGEWTYIEAEADKERFRGFVPSACLYETVTELSEARQAMLGSWRLYAGSSINASRITFREDGSMTGRTQLESGREMEWSGTWSIDFYDVRRDRYLNESEFELTLARGTATKQYGLRICRQVKEDGSYQYSLVISDGARTSDMVVCE